MTTDTSFRTKGLLCFLLLSLSFYGYSSAAVFDWVRVHENNARGTAISDACTDKKGNIYICGYNYTQSSSYPVIFKYDSLGNEAFSFNPGGQAHLYINTIGCDSLGSFYFVYSNPSYVSSIIYNGVTISSPTVGVPWQVVIKASSSGSYIWHRYPAISTEKLCVLENGKFYTTSLNGVANYDSTGTLIWQNNSVGGSVIKASNSALYVGSGSSISRLNLTTGTLMGSLSANGLVCMNATVNDKLYYSDSLGTHCTSALNPVWTNSSLQSVYLGANATGVWISTSAYATIGGVPNGSDTVFFMTLNPLSGVIQKTDTLLHLQQELAGTSTVVSSQSSGPLLLLGVAGSSYKDLVVPPQFLNATYFSAGDVVICHYSTSVKPTLAFGSSFWNINDVDHLRWRGYRRCAGGASFYIDFKFVDVTPAVQNILFAEISDNTGSFANPTVIGTDVSGLVSGSIKCSIPANVPDGSHYLIRLRSITTPLISIQSSGEVGFASPVSTLAISGTTTFCSKSKAISCTCVQPVATYQWNRNGVAVANSNVSQFFPGTSGTYQCVVTDVDGCSRYTENSITVNTLPLPPTANATITPVVPDSICYGDSVLISLTNPGAFTYQWYKYSTPIASATSTVYAAKVTGSYKVVVTGANGCTRSSSLEKVTVFKPVAKALGATTFCAGGNVVLSVDTANVTSIQWFKNSQPIAGQVGMYLIATQAAYYKALCMYRNGCSAYSNSIRVVVNCRLSENELENVLVVYPNPASQQFTIEAEGLEETGNAFLQISNALGQVVYWRDLVVADGSLKEDLLIDTQIPAGVYLVKLSVNNTVYSSRLVIQ